MEGAVSELFAVPSRLGRFVAYGLVGWCGEVLATGIHDYIRHRDNRLPARTSLWMFPVYGLLQPMFELLHDSMRDRAPAPVRAVAYAAGFFGVEYASGLVLRMILGRAPWDYTSTKRNVHGLIRLDYAPKLAGFGVALEPLHDALTGRGRSA
jgi:uncharacterized membrane protein